MRVWTGSRWIIKSQKTIKEEGKLKDIFHKMVADWPLNYKGGTLLAFKRMGGEKETLKQYREQSPRGRYLYRRRHGMTAWYKRMGI